MNASTASGPQSKAPVYKMNMTRIILGLLLATPLAAPAQEVTNNVVAAISLLLDESEPEMMSIPAGSFVMGYSTNLFPASDAWTAELPQHSVVVSPFYIGRHEVTKALWDEVWAWATNNGYVFDNLGSGKATNHPVASVNWHDMVKWCNARSQKEGWTPCYYTTTEMTSIYQAGRTNIGSECVNWNANGYRLPTEAEWEMAARGGVADHRFPWTDSDDIQHTRANYSSTNALDYDTSETRGPHPAYNDGVQPYSSPVGSFAPNGYGLYDLTGNMWERCWDGYDAAYYETSPAEDPRGAGIGTSRTLRGGSWSGLAIYGRVSFRAGGASGGSYNNVGFRLARSAVP